MVVCISGGFSQKDLTVASSQVQTLEKNSEWGGLKNVKCSKIS